MGRSLKFDVGEKVHGKRMGRTEDLDADGNEQLVRNPGTGETLVKKKDIVLHEKTGVVETISVNQDGGGPYVDYNVAVEVQGKQGPEKQYFWFREEELSAG